MPEIAQTPEAIALELLRYVAYAEGKAIGNFRNPGSEKSTIPDRKYILDTYAECLKTVRQCSALNDSLEDRAGR